MTHMQPQIIRPDETAEFWTGEKCHILELWNRDSSPALSVARTRVEPGVSTQPHSLDETAELYVMIAGEGIMHVEGLEQQRVTVGDCVAIPPGAVQWIENTGSCDLLFYAVCTPRFRPEVYRDRTSTQ